MFRKSKKIFGEVVHQRFWKELEKNHIILQMKTKENKVETAEATDKNAFLV